jgi:ketosteroid isomerase-like protein
MRTKRLRIAAFIISCGVLWASDSAKQTATAVDRAAIEKLHQADVTATLNNNADQLAALWADDAVLLGEGEAPVSGRRTLRDVYAKDPAKILKYTPHIESLEIHGNVAYEWGRFDALAKEAANKPAADWKGRFLRVMAKQPDGSWKFTRIMWQRDID